LKRVRSLLKNLELRGRNDKLSCVDDFPQFALLLLPTTVPSLVSHKRVILVCIIHLCTCWLAVAIDDFQVEAYEDCGSCIH
jgi:hypothetical protein